MSDISPDHCSRCAAPVLRLIEGLCPACLARNVRTGLATLLEPAPGTEELAPEIEGIEIREPLGAGGMGVVFRGVRESDGEPLAVKILPRGLAAALEWRERFQREAAALAMLDHPNIVRISGSGETADGRLYLAMELVEGCDLRRLLRAGKIDPARALDIAEKVAAALTHAHSRGIVHRDIKPGNVMVGDHGVVKVTDFGIARAAANEASDFNLTQTREAFGTPYYMAPEVAVDATAASPASDVYALGVMLYEMLTGRVPMGKFSPASREAGLDSRVDALLAAALADHPDARTARMEDMAAGLRAVRERLERRPRQRRWRITAAAIGLAALAAGTGAVITKRTLTSGPVRYPDPSAATRERPWENSLGMRFIPVSGTGVLFSLFETRRQDYRAYAAENSMMETDDEGAPSPMKLATIRNGQESHDDGTWQDLGFAQTDEHPVAGISMVSAMHFCRWLTTKERTQGRLQPGQHYRLPSGPEWDAASGNSASPGNFAGAEVIADGWPPNLAHGTRNDGWPRTSPAGSFPANAAGLFDMHGNVMEACMDRTAAPGSSPRNFLASLTARGGSWRTIDAVAMDVPEKRAGLKLFLRRADAGFRIVLDPGKGP